MASFLVTIVSVHPKLVSKCVRGINEQVLKSSGAEYVLSSREKIRKTLTLTLAPTPSPLYFRGLSVMKPEILL